MPDQRVGPVSSGSGFSKKTKEKKGTHMRSSVLIHPGELSPKWIDRLSSCGISALGIHPEGGSRAAESLDRLLDGLRAPAFRALLDTAAAKGLEIE